MKNLRLNFTLGLALVLTAIIAITFTISSAYAGDTILDATAQSVTVKADKNGNDYARILIQEDRELQGVAYKADVMVMCFGVTVDGAKKLTAGDKFKAVASIGEYNGSKNYRIVQFLPTE